MDQSARIQTETAVLEANQAFYAAFSRGDFEAMSELWAKLVPVACLHPGAPLISGRHAVLQSWRQLLDGARAWKMVSRDAIVHLLGDTAFVTCLEANGDQPAHLIATNIFVLEEEHWRVVHHQAGPLQAPQHAKVPSSLN
jgi:ketosteroid isomerase-like protein